MTWYLCTGISQQHWEKTARQKHGSLHVFELFMTNQLSTC